MLYTPQSHETNSTVASEASFFNYQAKVNKIKNTNFLHLQDKRISSKEFEKSTSDIEYFQNRNRLSAPLPKIRKEITLENFNIIEKIGKGAFGDVFLAQEK